MRLNRNFESAHSLRTLAFVLTEYSKEYEGKDTGSCKRDQTNLRLLQLFHFDTRSVSEQGLRERLIFVET